MTSNVVLEATPTALDDGARPLKRVIQQRIQNPQATEIPKGTFSSETGVRVDCHGGELIFEPLAQPEPAAT